MVIDDTNDVENIEATQHNLDVYPSLLVEDSEVIMRIGNMKELTTE